MTIKRITIFRNPINGQFLYVATEPNKRAKCPEGYERIGKSFLGNWDNADDKSKFVIQGA